MFFEEEVVVPSTTFFAQGAEPPEDMGFFAEGYKWLEARLLVKEAVEAVAPSLAERVSESSSSQLRQTRSQSMALS